MKPEGEISVVISNGAHRFHLSTAAAEMSKKGLLTKYITAGYPKKYCKKTLSLCPGLLKKKSVKRLLDREEYALEDKGIFSIWSVEIPFGLSALMRKIRLTRPLSEFIGSVGLDVYCAIATASILFQKVDIYHYRSGFGGLSVKVARWKGAICVCDHSAAEPSVFNYLIENNGMLPSQKLKSPSSRFWRLVKRDIEIADHIVVNSEFVKKTLVLQGEVSDRISVVYLGVDEKFLGSIPNRVNLAYEQRRVKLIYAGLVSASKGCNHLFDALLDMDPNIWQIEIAGGIDIDIERKYKGFLSKENVRCLGFVSRATLADRMSNSDIFIFPSLSEGSARVVFEAMACGCFIITTPNAGSMVEEGVNGFLVEAGTQGQIAESLVRALGDLDYCREVGAQNKKVIFREFTQEKYGAKLANIYSELSSEKSL